MSAVFELDKQCVRHSFATAAETYDGMAVLQRQVGLELLQQQQVEIKQGSLLDLGCGTGFIAQNLLRQQPQQVYVFALDIALSMCLTAKNKNNKHNNAAVVCADAELLPFKKDCFDAVYSNLAVQWCLNLKCLFMDIHRVLKSGGQFIMSTFGPSTLQELKSAWGEVDTYTHINDFYDSKKVTGLLAQTGFTDVKLRTQTHVSYYADVIALMKELKALGAHNACVDRNKKLTGKNSLQGMLQAYEQSRYEGRIPATYEIIYISAKVNKSG